MLGFYHLHRTLPTPLLKLEGKPYTCEHQSGEGCVPQAERGVASREGAQYDARKDTRRERWLLAPEKCRYECRHHNPTPPPCNDDILPHHFSILASSMLE